MVRDNHKLTNNNEGLEMTIYASEAVSNLGVDPQALDAAFAEADKSPTTAVVWDGEAVTTAYAVGGTIVAPCYTRIIRD